MRDYNKRSIPRARLSLDEHISVSAQQAHVAVRLDPAVLILGWRLGRGKLSLKSSSPHTSELGMQPRTVAMAVV